MRIPPLLLVLVPLLVGLPLAGIALAGLSLAPYLEFPPRTAYVVHAPFSWTAFAFTASLVIITVAPFVARILRHRASVERGPGRASAFPWWGWLACAWLALAWTLAWNRFEWFSPLQGFTFSTLWLGYIVIVNALTWRRTGRCMLINHPVYFLTLFPLSAAFWWLFEYLNRFVQNWHYMGIGAPGAWDYFWQATLPFATVLPAVLGTRELLASFPRASAGLENAWRIDMTRSKPLAWIALVFAAAALAGLGVWPNALFSALWLAPLVLISALQVITGERSILEGPADGDWRELWQVALAALVCGLFWEMWNYGSLAHWEYSVPLVHRFEIFHMPLLGYSGYLPFGLECLAIGKLLETLREGDRA